MCAQTFHWISQSDGMYAAGVSDPSENTHHKGKYHCMSDRFDWFGFDHATKAAANSTLAKHLNPNKINRRVIHSYFPLR